MEPVSDIRLREIEAFLSFVAMAESERAIQARSFQALGKFSEDDFLNTSEMFLDADATAGFAFLGRDAEQHGSTIEQLADAGHEIVIHGHRHVSFESLSYGTAHDDLSRGLRAIQDATGIRPVGFFAPISAVSKTTLQAASDLGIEWVLGRTDGEIPDGVTLVESVFPHDTRLLEEGKSAAATFEVMHDRAADDTTFLFHPNMLEYHSATDEFEQWVEKVRPVTISEHIAGGGTGIVLDSLRPIKPI